MTVERLMRKDVKSCSPSDTLSTAAKLMWENVCGCVPVIDTHGKPIGVLTDRDICMGAYTQGKPLDAIRVEQSSSEKVITCRAQDEVETAIILMTRHSLRRLPVVTSDGRLCGIVSLDDLACESLRNLRGSTNRELAAHVGEAFLAICSRRSRHVA